MICRELVSTTPTARFPPCVLHKHEVQCIIDEPVAAFYSLLCVCAYVRACVCARASVCPCSLLGGCSVFDNMQLAMRLGCFSPIQARFSSEKLEEHLNLILRHFSRLNNNDEVTLCFVSSHIAYSYTISYC